MRSQSNPRSAAPNLGPEGPDPTLHGGPEETDSAPKSLPERLREVRSTLFTGLTGIAAVMAIALSPWAVFVWPTVAFAITALLAPIATTWPPDTSLTARRGVMASILLAMGLGAWALIGAINAIQRQSLPALVACSIFENENPLDRFPNLDASTLSLLPPFVIRVKTTTKPPAAITSSVIEVQAGQERPQTSTSDAAAPTTPALPSRPSVTPTVTTAVAATKSPPSKHDSAPKPPANNGTGGTAAPETAAPAASEEPPPPAPPPLAGGAPAPESTESG